MKIPFSELKFKILDESTELSSFECGDSNIDDFLKNDAKSYQKDRLATTYLVYYGDQLVGFFSLAAGCIIATAVESPTDRLGNQPKKYPALRLAQLATSNEFQSRDIGQHMLRVVFAIALDLCRKIGCRVIIVDAKNNDRTINFYQKYGNFKKFGKGNDDTVPLMMDLNKAVKNGTVNLELEDFSNKK